MTPFRPGKHIITLQRPQGLVRENNACGLNSIITLLDIIGFKDKVAIESLKKNFDYNSEGISYERNCFHKLNMLLREKNVPYLFRVQNYSSLDDLYPLLTGNQNGIQLPVPVIFQMRILKIIQSQFKSEYTLDLGDVFQSGNKHILLFVGYDDEKEELYFIDPSYQLPFIEENEKDLSSYYVKLSKEDFYKNIKGIKTIIYAYYSKSYAKKYKKSEDKTQIKLNE